MRVVILGTGTGVGKTRVAKGLVAAFAELGSAVGLKPIETGGQAPSDGEELAAVSRPAPLGLAAPYRYALPLSPHLAAALARRRIDLGTVAGWVDEVEQSRSYARLVVETAGGVFTPLDDVTDNFDLARALGTAKWLLVASNRLGVLHDVRATLFAMKARGRLPDAIVLNQTGDIDESASSNGRELRRLCGLALVELVFGEETSLAELARAVEAMH